MWPGYWGLLSDSGRKGFTVTIYGAGASTFDGVMGSVRDHGLSGIIRLTNVLFSQVFRAYRVYHGHGGRTGIPVSRDQGGK